MVACPARFIHENGDGFGAAFRHLLDAFTFDLERMLEATTYGLGVALAFRIKDNKPCPIPRRSPRVSG